MKIIYMDDETIINDLLDLHKNIILFFFENNGKQYYRPVKDKEEKPIYLLLVRENNMYRLIKGYYFDYCDRYCNKKSIEKINNVFLQDSMFDDLIVALRAFYRISPFGDSWIECYENKCNKSIFMNGVYYNISNEKYVIYYDKRQKKNIISTRLEQLFNDSMI